MIVYVNARVRDAFGFDPQELVGRPVDVTLPDRLRAPRRALRAALLNSGVTQSEGIDHEHFGLHRDGHEVPVEVRSAAIEDGDGRRFLVSSIRDASSRRLRELALPAILEASINEIYVFDAHTLRFVDVNLAARRNLGYSMGELRELTPLDIKPSFSMAQFEQLLEPMRALEGQSSVFHTEHRRKDGTLYPVEVHLQFTRLGAKSVFLAVILDTSERVRTERELRESEARFREVTQGLPFPVWAHDAQGKQEFVNQTFCDIFGVDAQDVGTDRWRTLLHPDDESSYVQEFMRSVAERRPFHASCRVRTASGNWRVFDSHGRPRWAESGEFRGVIGSSTDITERIEAEEAVRLSEERFRTLVSTTATIVWSTDARGGGFRALSGWYDYTGQTPEEAHDAGWMKALHPEDRARIWHDWLEATRHGVEYRNHGRLWHAPSGAWRRFEVRAAPLRAQTADTAREWIGMCVDVEDQARLQEDNGRLAALAEHSADFVGVTDLCNRLLYLNPAGRRIIGVDDRLALPAVRWLDCFFPEDRERIAEQFLPGVLRDGAAETEVRLRNLGTGEATWMRYRAFVLKDSCTRPMALAMVSQDITQYRHLEQNLTRLAADLSQADRLKNEFLATLAHELRNPLAPIRSGIALLERKTHDPSAIRRTAEMLDRQSAHMVRLVDDLLDLGRITQGKIELRREPVDLMDIVHDALEVAQPQCDAQSITLRSHPPSEALAVDGDRVRLTQVIGNLLNNACKFNRRSGRIDLSVRRCGERAIISVQDDGIGIAASELGRLFTIFSQVPGSQHPSTGLGIGLAISKRLVELHDGTIEARSEGLGRGATFIVSLPLLDAEKRGRAGRAPDEAMPPRARAAGRSQRILIVDDNQDAATALAMMLEFDGHVVRTAFGGAQALGIVAGFEPELILMDIGMPEMNGYEVAARMRALGLPEGARIVALTGWGQPEDIARTLDAGMDAHLVKPVDPQKLRLLLADLD